MNFFKLYQLFLLIKQILRLLLRGFIEGFFIFLFINSFYIYHYDTGYWETIFNGQEWLYQ